MSWWTGNSRARFIALSGLLVPLGIAVKLYSGPGANWIHFNAGDIIYEIFWVFAVLAIFPHHSRFRVGLGVFFATCGLEILQLWHPPLLEAVRSTFVGHALLGSVFVWADFPRFAVGCALAVWLAGKIRPLAQNERATRGLSPRS